MSVMGHVWTALALTQPVYSTSMPQSGRRPQHQKRTYALKFQCPLYLRKRTFAPMIRMSALGHKLPCAPQQIALLFDHLIGSSKQLGINVEAERLGSFQVNHQIVLRWCLHRHVLWFLAPENAIDIRRRLPKLVNEVSPVGHETTVINEVAREINRRQSVPSRQGNEQLAMNIRERAGGYDQASISRVCKGHNSAFDLTRVSHVERAYFYADRRRDRLDHRELGDFRQLSLETPPPVSPEVRSGGATPAISRSGRIRIA